MVRLSHLLTSLQVHQRKAARTDVVAMFNVLLWQACLDISYSKSPSLGWKKYGKKGNSVLSLRAHLCDVRSMLVLCVLLQSPIVEWLFFLFTWLSAASDSPVPSAASPIPLVPFLMPTIHNSGSQTFGLKNKWTTIV